MVCGCSSAASSGEVWRPDDGAKPTPSLPENAANIYRPDILQHIEETLKELDGELRELSLNIHAHPQIAYEER
ncbi:hypothetical protein H0H93_003763 [Arthromyces matolae]|nr:hypothetical protein H0H93_003763 [Arthromyces matolae]